MSSQREQLSRERDRLAQERRREKLYARKHRTLTARVKRLVGHVKRIRARIVSENSPIGLRALAAAAQMLGKFETGNNDAPWLRAMEADLVRAGSTLSWMIPGNPYCGMGVLWSYFKAGLRLPDNFVGTTNIMHAAGQVFTSKSGMRFKLVACSPENARPGAIIVFDWAPGTGADHTGLARGPMRGGEIPTREFNTSPSNAGSQGNGGGVYDRTRPRSVILGVLNVVPA